VAATSVTVDMPAYAYLGVDEGHASDSVAAIADALEAALRARAPAQHAGTPLVRKLAAKVADDLGLGDAERKAVDVCAQVRDVGMIALPDPVIQKTGPLTPSDWAQLNRHPDLGAKMLESFPGMLPTAALVRSHHERWDGGGYPDGLSGEAIPLPSRIVSVCDAFMAIATDRPHRRGIGAEGAIDYIRGESNAQFDPGAVECLLAILRDSGRSRQRPAASQAPPAAPRAWHEPRPASRGARELRGAMAEFATVPAFEPAVERVLAATEFAGPFGRGDLVNAIEGDIGATVAILRVAQPRSDAPVAGIPDALALLAPDEIRATITALPTVSFPWQTRFEALLLRCLTHAQAVARAADRLAHLVSPFSRDKLVTSALLHDVGKLLLALVWPDFAVETVFSAAPEDALRRERREFGFDHATLGGLLIERWGLPNVLVRAVSGHHSGHASPEAVLIRLADMVVHHAHGDAVDRDAMLRLATRCHLSVGALRTIVVDLPHSGAVARRRGDGSPLSSRESDILKLLATGLRGAAIARELDLTESTVRTHLHNIYAKLEVPDRAQAVLRATEMAWI
jgi:putative nucleotidyltransferase with HDIG domain